MHGKIAPTPIHDAILELAPCHIITTNYDDLIEQNIEQKFMQYHIIRKDILNIKICLLRCMEILMLGILF